MLLDPVLSWIISDACAETVTSTPSTSQGNFSFILMIAVLFIFIYFAILRPQNKRAKDQQSLMKALMQGDEVMTASGILGRIIKVTDQYVILSLAKEVNVVVQKTAISDLLPKGTLKSIE